MPTYLNETSEVIIERIRSEHNIDIYVHVSPGKTYRTVYTLSNPNLTLLSLDPVFEEELLGEPVNIAITGSSELTDNQVQRSIITNYGMSSGGTTVLPEFNDNTNFTILVEVADQEWLISPPSGETIYLDGVSLGVDHAISVGKVIGDTAVLVRTRMGVSSYVWFFYTVSGDHIAFVA